MSSNGFNFYGAKKGASQLNCWKHDQKSRQNNSSRKKNMAAMTLNLLQQMMANGDTTVADLASLVNTNSQQELYNHEDNAATPGSVDETGFEETETIVSVVTTTPENNLQGRGQYNGEELPAAKFDKEVFLEEVRKYRCLWDIASEGYKIRPMKQNAWSKIGHLFNKDGEFTACGFRFVPQTDNSHNNNLIILRDFLCWTKFLV